MSSPERNGGDSSGFDTSTDSLHACEKGQRRASKSFAERKRRAKINEYLQDLQKVLCPSGQLTKDKKLMEKAEVLKMSIVEINRLRRQVADLKSKLKSPMAEGYRACQLDTQVVIRHTPYLSADMKDLLVKDLAQTLQTRDTTQRVPLSLRNDTNPSASDVSAQQGAVPVTSYPQLVWRTEGSELSNMAGDYVDQLLWRPW